ncbi:MAG: hypothetical protein O3C46_04880 [Bacteroidetes bacterium]|jgi:hypothetical protein|nr:hypothetical protein [Bacteroidota bacterium]MDA0931312.1 hypothetical protein [Bacteroidota bacterium]
MWKKLLHYANPLTLFRKSDASRNINLTLMHGINRISILMFLLALVVMVVKFWT